MNGYRPIVCAALLALCALSPIAAAGEDGPIGCYSVELLPLGLADTPVFEPVMQKSIRLTNEVVMTRKQLAFKVVPLARAAFMYRLAFWHRLRDEVTLTFTEDERAGLRMHLRLTAVGLEGTLSAFGASSDIADVFNVVARRIDCRVSATDSVADEVHE